MRDQSGAQVRPCHHGDLRGSIIDHVMAILAEGKASQLTLRDVACRAGFSHCAPYKKFPDRATSLVVSKQTGLSLAMTNGWMVACPSLRALSVALHNVRSVEKMGSSQFSPAALRRKHFRLKAMEPKGLARVMHIGWYCIRKKCHLSFIWVLTPKWSSPITPLVDDARRPGASH